MESNAGAIWSHCQGGEKIRLFFSFEMFPHISHKKSGKRNVVEYSAIQDSIVTF